MKLWHSGWCFTAVKFSHLPDSPNQVATFFFFKFMRLAQSWSRSLAASMTIAFFYHTIKLASCKSQLAIVTILYAAHMSYCS